MANSANDNSKLSPQKQEYLEKLYNDPGRIGSLSGIAALSRAIKKEKKFKISLKELKEWLQSHETYSLHKQLRRKFDRNRIVVSSIGIEWESYLADMALLKEHNNGYSYFIVFIDDFSKFAYAKPLKTKTAKEVATVLKEILENNKKIIPLIIRTDQGGEFVNTQFNVLLKSYGIRHWVTQNEQKCSIAERLIKSLKNKIYRYFTLTQELNWINILQKVIDTYNHTFHRSIGMTPVEVNKNNEDKVWKKLQPPKNIKKPLNFKFDIGDKVRISVLRKAFEREYDIKWTVEFFIVADRFFKEDIPKYKLKDYANEEILGTFYEDELQKINVGDDTVYRIEKIVRRRTKRGRREVLIKWVGWPSKFNSWIPNSELQDYQDIRRNI
jgi:transposase InsO family protein